MERSGEGDGDGVVARRKTEEPPAEPKEARHGDKMIEVRIRFWTDNITEKGKVVPRRAWDSGVVVMDRNDSHGIQPQYPTPFNSYLELPEVIAKVLVGHKVKLQRNRKSRKLLD